MLPGPFQSDGHARVTDFGVAKAWTDRLPLSHPRAGERSSGCSRERSQRLADARLVKGKTIGIDSTTLEANAALRSIVRRDTSESYQVFLTRLAQASGIETPTREDLARLDRKRKGKGSNRQST
jgi:hypothetical protein